MLFLDNKNRSLPSSRLYFSLLTFYIYKYMCSQSKRQIIHFLNMPQLLYATVTDTKKTCDQTGRTLSFVIVIYRYLFHFFEIDVGNIIFCSIAGRCIGVGLCRGCSTLLLLLLRLCIVEVLCCRLQCRVQLGHC